MWGLQKKYIIIGFFVWIVIGFSPLFEPFRRWTVRSMGWDYFATSEEILITHEYDNAEHGIYKQVVLETEDGCRRSAIMTLRPNARGNIVLCHPATYDKEFMKVFVDKVFAQYNCIRFDFRRHGQEADLYYSTCGKKEVYEVEAAVQAFKEHGLVHNLPTYGFGISLGAAVLIEAESKKPMFDGLILQSTFERLSLQIRRTMPLFNFPPFRFFIFREPTRFYFQKMYGIRLNRINPVKSIKKVHIPIFLIHAQDDAYIPFEAFESLLIAGGGTIVRTWTPVTGGHTAVYSHHPELYATECNTFLQSLERKKAYVNVLIDAHNALQDQGTGGYRMSLTATTSEDY